MIGTIALLLASTCYGGASAKPSTAMTMVGVWSGEAPGQGGMVHGSDRYLADGSYVSVAQLPNGSIQRIWGSYRTQPVSPSRIHLSLQTQGYLPRQICAQAPGFSARCSPNRVAPSMELDVDFVSYSKIRVNGVAMQRSGGSRLLTAQVPERLMLAAAAPVVPHIQQPVMPNTPGHYTPTGPGSVQGMHRDDELQQHRICAVNGGQLVRELGGRLRCVN